MGKKAGKRSTAAKKAAGARKKAVKGPVNRKEVREEIAGLVATNISSMTTAIIEEAKKGCLPQYKCLLEVSSVFPPSQAEESAEEDGDGLAKVLLERLHLPNSVEDDEGAESSTAEDMGKKTVSVE
jgi:hypothetical protein